MDAIAGYHDLADALLRTFGVGDKAMHVHAGLAIYVVAGLLLRTRRGSIDALLAVVLCEAANEAMDRLFFGAWRWSDTLGDIAATLAWPTILFVSARYRRARWSRTRRSPAAAPARAPATARPAGRA